MVTKTWSKFFTLASWVTDDASKNALLVHHMVGQETQDIFDTLTLEQCDGELYKSSLDALYQQFCIKNIISIEKAIYRPFKE